MKYFTEEWCFGRIKESEIKTISKSYLAYLEGIYEKLPFPIKLLSRQISLHDGILEEIQYNEKNATLTLKGSFGDLQVGFFFLRLQYSGVSDLNLNALSALCKEKKLEILNDEIELLSGDRYSHRIFFAVKREIEILFHELDIEIARIDGKEYDKSCRLTFIEF